MQHSSCCCGHYFNCFLSVLLVHVLRAANFRFLFLLSTAVWWSCRWTISSTCWIGSASQRLLFSFSPLSVDMYVRYSASWKPDPTWSTPYPTGLLCIFAWDFGTRGKGNSANFMLQSSGNLFSSSRVVACHFRRVYSDCRPFFSSNLLIHSSADAIKNSLFFFPLFPTLCHCLGTHTRVNRW